MNSPAEAEIVSQAAKMEVCSVSRSQIQSEVGEDCCTMKASI